MVTYYELYSDECRPQVPNKDYLVLGGLICTETGRRRLFVNLEQVRRRHNKRGEMKWNEISNSNLDFEAYKDWVNVFFKDRFARFVLFSINRSSSEWLDFYRQKRQNTSQEASKAAYQEGLSAAYHQFLLVSFGELHDTKRWIVYPDNGLFSNDNILEMTKKHFNRTYKFPKSSNNIRFMKYHHSDEDDLLQLTDVLLGAFSHDYYLHDSVYGTQYDILKHCKDAIQQKGFTERNLPKLVSKDWVPEDQYDYALNFKLARSARWTQSY